MHLQAWCSSQWKWVWPCAITWTTCYNYCTLVHFMLAKNLDVVPTTIDHILTYYIPWEFTSCSKLHYYEDFCVYLGLEEPCHDLEFLLTPVQYDEWGNDLRYSLKPVRPIEVTEDQGDHSDMSSREIEEYSELMWQLEPPSEQENDDPSQDTSQIVKYFQ